MSDTLIGSPLPCSPANRVVLARGVDGVPRSNGLFPGTWYRLEPTGAPYIVCPRCGETGRLGNHLIAETGDVSPSVVCVMQSCGDGVKRCDAHYYARLEGYEVLT